MIYAKPAPTGGLKGGKLEPAKDITTIKVNEQGVEKKYITLKDGKEYEVREDILAGTILDKDGLYIPIGLDIDLSDQASPVEPDKDAKIGGLTISVTTGVNHFDKDGRLISNEQVTITGADIPADNPST
jgi:hypothetical protein